MSSLTVTTLRYWPDGHAHETVSTHEWTDDTEQLDLLAMEGNKI